MLTSNLLLRCCTSVDVIPYSGGVGTFRIPSIGSCTCWPDTGADCGLTTGPPASASDEGTAEGGEVMAAFEIAMMGKLPYTALRDGIFAHPTLAESLNNLFTAMDSGK